MIRQVIWSVHSNPFIKKKTTSEACGLGALISAVRPVIYKTHGPESYDYRSSTSFFPFARETQIIMDFWAAFSSSLKY